MASGRMAVLAVAAALTTAKAGGPDAYAGAARAVETFAAALAAGDAAAMAGVLDPVFTARSVGEDGALRAQSREDFLKSLSPNAQAHLTSLQLFFDDFAVARLDDWQGRSAQLLTLFRTEAGWRLAGVSSARAADGVHAARFNPDIAARAVLDVLDVYYTSVDEDDAAPLARAFHADWRMKNLEGGAVASEPKGIFMARLGGGKHKGYAGDRQIADVQVIYDRLAFVRVDKPSTPGVTVFIFYKVNGEWAIVDKAWSSAAP